MAERSILFSASMIRALLDGRKTQTRRLAHLKPRVGIQIGDGPPEWIMVPSLWQSTKLGSRLWVRETWMPRAGDMAISRVMTPHYRADAASNRPEWQGLWRPSIHMPRWASRLTLTIEDVRVQRLQAITEADARAEGIADGGCLTCGAPEPCGCPTPAPCARDSFAALWDSLHGPGAWMANPEIVALTFSVAHRNIDQPRDAAQQEPTS